MKKEIIILIIDSVIYQIAVDDEQKKVESRNPSAAARDTLFVTFQSDELLPLLEDKVKDASILDLECLDIQVRQAVGLERSHKWSIPEMLHTYLGLEEKSWNVEEYPELLQKIKECYLVMKEKAVSEWKRIVEVELPINSILYNLQSQGVYVNHSEIMPLCESLHRFLYEIKNRIQLKLGFVGDNLEAYLRKSKIQFALLTRSEQERLFDLYPELTVFGELERAQRNFDCLIVLSAIRKEVNLCKPLFKGFGTTTGRIILRAPALQNLNSKYRVLLKNDNLPDGKRYVYIDYGQFEAGVLAGLVDNKKFIELYEQDKVYETLAQKTKFERSKAKKVFYCFIYGGIVWRGAESFFTEYGLKQSIDSVVEKALADGYIETRLGNRKTIVSEDDERLILNHYVQGTSSLIFKQALLNVYNTYREKVNLVLPMHDAALYLVDNDVETSVLVNLFRDAFKKWLPNVNPIVKEKDFFGNA